MTKSPNVTFNDGQQIPQLGYGVWQVEDDVAEKVVGQALDAGFRHIDTAKIYGNEAGVGRGIAGSDVDENEIFVTTKLWNDDQGYESTLKAFDQSAERLGLSKPVDLYLIHWAQPDNNLYLDTWKAMIDLQKKGSLEDLKNHPFTIKEGATFRMKVRFQVQHQVLSGLKYVQVVKRAVAKQKMQEMIVCG